MKAERVIHLLEVEKQYALKQRGFQQQPINKEVAEALDIAINVIKVKHGKWKMYVDEYLICATEFVCSNCNESFCSSEITDAEFTEMMKYCPNCGAKMKGVDNG